MMSCLAYGKMDLKEFLSVVTFSFHYASCDFHLPAARLKAVLLMFLSSIGAL